MSQNVSQWLAEIQSLQRQVTMLQQEREQAYHSGKSWRDLYEGEAKQRQRDAVAHSRKLAQLEQTLKSLQSADTGGLEEGAQTQAGEAVQDASARQLETVIATIQQTTSVEQLQTQLIASQRQCAQLKRQLKAEQDEHEQTRESLTAALGDAVDLLAKERLPERSGETLPMEDRT